VFTPTGSIAGGWPHPLITCALQVAALITATWLPLLPMTM
jgi:hypothetical protein